MRRFRSLLIATASLTGLPANHRDFDLPIARPSLPNVEAWSKRLQERAAYREHVMIDYSALRVEGA